MQNARLPFLEATIWEILRHARVVSIGTRQTVVDTTVLGHVIPAGTPIMLLFGHAGLRDETEDGQHDGVRSETSLKSGPRRHFADVLAFEPARWLREDGSFDPNAGSDIPFGGGVVRRTLQSASLTLQRGCFGKALALLDLRLFFAMVSLSIRLEPVAAALDTDRATENVTHAPREVYVGISAW